MWGDPALYDSTLGILEEVRERGAVAFDYDVVPGVSSVSALVARHRTGLNRVARPVQITTGRRLAEEGFPPGVDDVVVMLDAHQRFSLLPARTWTSTPAATSAPRTRSWSPVRSPRPPSRIERLRAEARSARGGSWCEGDVVTVVEETALPASQPPVLDTRRRNVVFVTIMLGMLLAALDQTIVGTALPTIVSDLGGADHMSWVVTSYLLAETVATVLAGKFGDLFGRKVVFQVSAIVFITGSFLCGLGHQHVHVDRLAGDAGHRRRRADGHVDGVDRRRHSAARARQVPGRDRRGASVWPPSSGRARSAGSSPTI
ncbi:Putative multidrug resistance protein MdtD [Streptomyces tendae]